MLFLVPARSTTTNRGPLSKDWLRKTETPFMCCYKLVTVKFKWWGLQNTVEDMLLASQQSVFEVSLLFLEENRFLEFFLTLSVSCHYSNVIFFFHYSFSLALFLYSFLHHFFFRLPLKRNYLFPPSFITSASLLSVFI